MKTINWKKHSMYLLGAFLILTMIFPSLQPNFNNVESIKAKNHLIKISNSDLNNNLIKLEGEWQFYWKQFIVSAPDVTQSNYKLISVPKNWTDMGYPYKGYASYRVRIQFDQPTDSLQLRIENVRQSSRVYMNGELVGKSGNPGTTDVQTTHLNRPYLVPIPDKVVDVDLVVEVANYRNITSGISKPIMIGSSDNIVTFSQKRVLVNAAIIAGSFFLAIMFLPQVFRNISNYRTRTIFLYFVLMCLGACLLELTQFEKMIYIFNPDLSIDAFSRIQTYAILITMGAFYLYSTKMIGYTKTPISNWIFLSILTFATITIFATPMDFYYGVFLICMAAMIGIQFGVNIYSMIKQEKMFRDPIWELANTSYMCYIITTEINFYYNDDLYPLSPLYFLIFVIMQAFSMNQKLITLFNEKVELATELATLNRYKDNVLIRTFYSLKHPISSLRQLASIRLAESGKNSNPQHQKEFELIAATMKSLDSLVNDLIDNDRIKNQKLQVELLPIELNGIVLGVKQLINVLYVNRKINLDDQLVSNIYIVESDENRLQQMMYHILNYMATFTDEIDIRTSIENDTLTICFVDVNQRCSIENIKNAIYYEDTHQDIEQQELNETGLGLIISRTLADQLSCKLSATQKENDSVYICLELHCVTQINMDADVATIEVAEQHSNGNGLDKSNPDDKTILFISDNELERRIIEKTLQLEGYKVIFSSDEKTTMKLLKRHKSIQLIIIDSILARIPAIKLCEKIREGYPLLELPIILTLLQKDEAWLRLSIQIGINECMVKPIGMTELVNRVRTLIEVKEAYTSLMKNEMLLLRAQIKPHFLFNAINTIISITNENPQLTRDLLIHLSQYLRYSFDFDPSVSELPFSSELNLIRSYLALEKARFEDRLEIEEQLEVTDFKLPPLLIQPIVENAVKHGLMQKAQGGKIIIRTKKVDSGIEIHVEDNGVGIKNATRDFESTGIGLMNISQRLLKQYNQSLSINPRKGGGTIVTILIPFEGDELK